MIPRYEVENADLIAAINHRLDAMDEFLLQASRDMDRYTGTANTNRATLMRVYGALKIIRQKVILEMGRQDMDPRLRFALGLISVALGCVTCSLLMNVLLADMPWMIFVFCVFILVISFAYITN